MRKGAALAEIYDARAIRIVVNDAGGTKTQVGPLKLCFTLMSLNLLVA